MIKSRAGDVGREESFEMAGYSVIVGLVDSVALGLGGEAWRC